MSAKQRTILTFQLDDELLEQLQRVMAEQELPSINRTARAVLTGALKNMDLVHAAKIERVTEIVIEYRKWYVGRLVVFMDELRLELLKNLEEGKTLQELGQ